VLDSINKYLEETVQICKTVDREDLVSLCRSILDVKKNNGRIFIAGVGGSAANATHAVNDFRKILGIETHSLSENISELTARINDDGWEVSFTDTLKVFKPNEKDLLLVFSVGGGSDTTSRNLVHVMNYMKSLNCKICSIVSRDGGQAKLLSDVCVLIPVVNNKTITPHAEEMQGVVWHMIVSFLGGC
jgi:D-sedoheptulose 7-phosphate isomerase